MRNDAVSGVIRSLYQLNQLTLEVSFTVNASDKGLQVDCRLKILVPPQAAEGNINGWQLPLEIEDGYWFRFSHAISHPQIYCDHPFASGSTKKQDFHALTYLDIIGEKTGLLVTHSGTQYFRLRGNRVENLFLREWESHFTQQYGWPAYVEYRYLLTPHSSGWTAKQRLMQARRLDQKDVVCVSQNQDKGTLPARMSFLEMRSECGILSCLRRQGEKLEFRFVETEGRGGKVLITQDMGIKVWEKTDMLGNPLQEKKQEPQDLLPWKVDTYRCAWERRKK